MNKTERQTLTAERKACDCGSLEDWQEIGSTWLCTCPDKNLALDVKREGDTVSLKPNIVEQVSNGYSDRQLIGKILEIYPEISKHHIFFSLKFNAEKDAYILDFRKGGHELTTHLEKKDADECMANIKCVYLGVQVGQFIRNFEEGILSP